MNNIIENWRNEFFQGLQAYQENSDLSHLVELTPEEIAEDYIEAEIEGEWLNEEDSWIFINHDQDIYREMENFCRNFSEQRMSLRWETESIEQVVGKWREFTARDFVFNAD